MNLSYKFYEVTSGYPQDRVGRDEGLRINRRERSKKRYRE